MRRRTFLLLAIGGLGLLITTSVITAAPDSLMAVYDVPWWTVEGGHGASVDGGSVGGPYALSGTAGQADAQPSSGGVYELTRGFWNDTITSPYRIYLPIVRK